MTGLSLNWIAPGPVAAAFMASTARVPGLMGPVGSGKTSTVIMKCVRLAAAQEPSPVDGWKRFKVLVVRDTYRRLWRTTIRSWHQWLPKAMGTWTGGEDQPATHTIRFEVNGAKIEFTAEFIAIGDQDIEDVLRGYEPTIAWLNEADRLAPEVLIQVLGRLGRFPPLNHGGPTYEGVLLDFNAPDTENYLYDLLVENCPDDFAFFRQPSGLSPQAENLQNLKAGADYYKNLTKGQPDWWVRRFVLNEFGYSREGKPVYGEYNDQLHCAAEDLAPIEGIALTIGLDAGGTPAATIWQRMPNGQWRGLDELVAPDDENTGPARFSDQLNRLLRDRYPGFQAFGYADPSAAYGADKQDTDSKTWIEIVANKTNLRILPAPTNDLTPRLEAVRLPLTRMIDGHYPGLIISPRMKAIRRGFNSLYRYKRIRGETGGYRDTPDKNEASHPHDSAQYALLGGGDYDDVMGRERRSRGRHRQTRAIDEDNPTGHFDDERPARRHDGGRPAYALSD